MICTILAKNQSLEENNCIENFKKFVGDCKLIIIIMSLIKLEIISKIT